MAKTKKYSIANKGKWKPLRLSDGLKAIFKDNSDVEVVDEKKVNEFLKNLEVIYEKTNTTEGIQSVKVDSKNIRKSLQQVRSQNGLERGKERE